MIAAPLRSPRSLVAVLFAAGLAGCAWLAPAGPPPPALFALEPALPDAPPHGPGAPTVAVAPTAARPGFDGPRMAYVTRPYEIQFFARHQWVEPPARMLAPLVDDALGRAGLEASRSGDAPSAPRLETEVVALQQEFTERPSRVRFTLRARLVAGGEGRTVAASEFEAIEPAPSDDPYGGVVAANRAVARVLAELARWCAANVPGAGGPG